MGKIDAVMKAIPWRSVGVFVAEKIGPVLAGWFRRKAAPWPPAQAPTLGSGVASDGNAAGRATSAAAVAAPAPDPFRPGGIVVLVLVLGLAAPARAQIHTAHDHIPDFCPSAPAWASGVPAGGAVVRVPSGVSVTLTAAMAAPARAICVAGTLTLGDGATLAAGTIVVEASGRLEAGTAARPGRAEIVIANQAIDTAADPAQWGTGLIVAGAVALHGAPVASFVRLAAAPVAGASTLTLEAAPLGWAPGHRIVIPDSRHLTDADRNGWGPTVPQWEEATIAAIAGRVVTLAAPLRWAHPGAKGRPGAADWLAHVANLSRSVVVRSASPTQTVRGHVAATGRAEVDLRYVRFADLGRTTIDPIDPARNPIGRYPVHLHHLIGPRAATGAQFTVIGNAVDGGTAAHRRKWGIVVHDSHYGRIEGNAVYNAAGAAFMFEDGNEYENLVDGNIAIRSTGEGDRLALGTEGGGFWMRGPFNRIRNNVAANLWADQPEAAYGFKVYARYLGPVVVPARQGDDPAVAGEARTVDGNGSAVPEFSNNEVYGAAQGLTYWWIGTQDPAKTPGYTAISTFRDTRIWAIFNIGVYHYPSALITFDGLAIRGIGQASACCKLGWYGGDYAAHDITIRRADIFDVPVGISVASVAYGTQTIEDSTVDTIRTTPLYSVNGGDWIPARRVVVRRTTGRILREWSYDPTMAARFNTTQADTLIAYAHGGDPAANFQAYYAEQATQAIAGGRAPSGATTRADVVGLVRAVAGEGLPIAVACVETAGPWGPGAPPDGWPADWIVEGALERQTRARTWTQITAAANGGAACTKTIGGLGSTFVETEARTRPHVAPAVALIGKFRSQAVYTAKTIPVGLRVTLSIPMTSAASAPAVGAAVTVAIPTPGGGTVDRAGTVSRVTLNAYAGPPAELAIVIDVPKTAAELTVAPIGLRITIPAP